MKSVAYPAIALIISIFILILTFGLIFYGVGSHLEKNRVLGLEFSEDMKNYNLLQYYLYVLSDYESRSSFFNILADIYNNSIISGKFDIQFINNRVWNSTVYNSIQYDQWCNYIVGVYRTTDWIYGKNLLVIYPCMNPAPFYNFSTNLNRKFLEKVFNSFNDSIFKDFENFKSHYNFSLIKLNNVSFYLSETDFSVNQKINYSYNKDIFSRELEIEVNYSLIPYVVLYNELLYRMYEIYVNFYVEFLKRASREGNKITLLNNVLPNKISDYNFETTYTYETNIFIPYFSNIVDILNLYSINKGKINFYPNLYYPFFCSQVDYKYSWMIIPPYPKEIIKVCEVTKIPSQEVIVYDYTIQECLLDNLVIEVSLPEINEIISEVIFYNFSFYNNLEYVNPKNLEIIRGIYDNFPIPIEILGDPKFDNNKNDLLRKNIEKFIYKSKDYRDYLWTVDEKQSFLVSVSIGEFYPVRCTIGYKYFSHQYNDLANCIEILKMLRQDPYVKIISPCNEICIRWTTVCTVINEDTICYPVCAERRYLLEYKRRAKSIYIENSIENLSLAIYYPIERLESLEVLIRQ